MTELTYLGRLTLHMSPIDHAWSCKMHTKAAKLADDEECLASACMALIRHNSCNLAMQKLLTIAVETNMQKSHSLQTVQ